MVPIQKIYIRAVKMYIGTNNLGVETYGKRGKNVQYICTIVRRICRTFHVVIFAKVNESLMNEKIVVIPVVQ